jgi:N-acyl-phosphatidylethanolamine-hydrolysing phospholipase D
MPDVHTPPYATREHHAPGGGFRNVWRGPQDDVSPLQAARWLAGFALRRRASPEPTPHVGLGTEALAAPPSGVVATWLGHSSALLRAPGATVLTDPVFADRVSPVSWAGPERLVALPVEPAALPAVDLVVLSHDHYDHLDADAVAFLHDRDRPLFACGLGVGAWLRRHLGAEARVVELDWWQWTEAEAASGAAVRVQATPAKHFSGRGPLGRDGTLWCGFHLTFPDGAVVYYAGDTGWAPVFREIGERLAPADLALVPVGAYLPRWFMARVHVDPPAALDVFEAVGAREMLAVHWGTFPLSDDRGRQPERETRAEAGRRGIADRVHVVPVGGQAAVRAAALPKATG